METEEQSFPVEKASLLALGGLLWGIGTLDAVEVLRYLDATFRDLGGKEIREGEKGPIE